MILVNLRIGRIVEGYERICYLERTLLTQWRHRLLATYAQRRKKYERQITQPKRVFWGGWVTAIVLIALGVGTFRFFGENTVIRWIAFAVAAFGLIGVWGVIAYGVYASTRAKPQPPPHPLHKQLIQPMLPRWHQVMQGRFPPTDPGDYGATAEQKFVQYMSDVDSSFILYRLKQRENEDADVIVVGLKGIWVFEVKFWSGKITYRDGKWERDDRILKTEDGKREKMHRVVTQPPDELWRRECSDIVNTLRRRAGALVARVPALIQIQGGIVFTHPNAKLDIHPSLSVEWNNAEGWKRKFSRASAIPEMDERTSLEVLDALLSWYQELTNMSALVSMDRIAREMGQQAKSDLERWINPSAR